MTTSSIAVQRPRSARRRKKASHMLPIAAGCLAGIAGIALVTYLLWPTSRIASGIDPARLPVSVGSTPFNVPLASIRIKAQRRTGQQERIDLAFLYPSLAPPPEKPAHATVESVLENEAPPDIDRIFVSLLSHRDAMAPEERVKTVYPRYVEGTPQNADGLSQQSFRSETPYRSEDLFAASEPAFVARCTRDAATPGMCMSERRIGGADLTFRFPRAWLVQWRNVATAMDDITIRLRSSNSR
jgi:hypothetical protein